MASWKSKEGIIHHYPARDMGNGWLSIDCGCCGGIRWGGEYPVECSDCEGSGTICWHKKSGVYALYPGGPFRGKGEPTKLELKGGEL